MICKECNAEISSNICPNCGYKNKSKKQKVIVFILSALIIAALIITSIFMLVECYNNNHIKSCVAEGRTFSSMIADSKRNFDTIGLLYSSTTKMNYGYSWDEEYFTNYVTGLCSSEISEEKSNLVSIKAQYETIKDVGYANDEIKKIQTQSENLYRAYEDMYKLIVEQNFTYSNFNSKYSQTNNELEMALELYDSVLKEAENK